MKLLRQLLLTLTVSIQAVCGAMPAPVSQDSYAKSASSRQETCAECYEVDIESVAPTSANAHSRLVMCGIEGAASAALTGDCIDMGNMAKDCLTSCLWSMLPIPDPCGKFGKLFSMGIGLANSFEQDTLVHTRVLTDHGYQKQLKRIADIQVGDEVLAWDEVKAFDIAQTKELQKFQAKSASSRQETCAECYENSSNFGNSSSQQGLQTALLQSAVGTQLTDSAESYQKVTHLMNSIKEQTLYYISLDNGEVFTATAGHPFKTNEGWRDAVLLKKGGKLLLRGGEGYADSAERYATITSIREEVQTIRMFNFEVGQLHTYFIGVDGVVVHNGYKDAKRGDLGRNADGEFSWLNPTRCSTNKTLKRRWSKDNNKDWPSGHDFDHIGALADGYPDHQSNGQPMLPNDHRDKHSLDRSRWSRR